VEGRKRRRHLIDGSYRRGRKPDTVAVTNTGSRAGFVFLDVFLPQNGPLTAEYAVEVATGR